MEEVEVAAQAIIGKKTNQGGKGIDIKTTTATMKEEMDQIETQEEIMNIDKITIANREEKKKTEDMEDKIGGKKEDSMNTGSQKDPAETTCTKV